MKQNNIMDYVNSLAKTNIEIDELPIAAVIIKSDNIISYGLNNREKTNDITGHAEINAIKKASKELGTWKLDGCDIYVSCMPCMMCYGAIKSSRINKIYIGSYLDYNKHNLNYVDEEYICDIFCNNESREMIQEFFKKKRG